MSVAALGQVRSWDNGKKRLEGVDRTVHVVELTDLEPGTSYHFVVGDPISGFREERRFRTVPADGSPIRFVTGGDMGTGLMPRMISARAAEQNPAFALLGGDISYASGRLKRYHKWPAWFADWEATMRTPDGHLIPMVVASVSIEFTSGRPNSVSRVA